MVDRAFDWAQQNKKHRVNPVHGEAEAFLVLSESFSISSTDVEESMQSGSMIVEDPLKTLKKCLNVWYIYHRSFFLTMRVL